MVIFCCTQVVAKTSTGIIKFVGSDCARSNHKKLEFSGAAEYIGAIGIQEYSFSEKPTRSSGRENTVWIRTRKSPIKIGI